MFKWSSLNKQLTPTASTTRTSVGPVVEGLEDRRLLSAASLTHHLLHAAKQTAAHHTTKAHAAKVTKTTKTHSAKATAALSTTTATSTASGTSTYVDQDGEILRSIQFSQTPTAVQTGLKSLASTDGLTAPASTDTVYLGNSNGIETYTLIDSSTGTSTRITVDQSGKAVTDPTRSTTTFGTLNGTGTGSDAKAAAEITKIAAALGLTAPADTDTVNVVTSSSGAVTYSIALASSSTSASSSSDEFFHHGALISVDANGNPVGNQNLPFSALPTAIQNGIIAHTPSGAAALTSNSTQTVRVRTLNGVTFYSTTFTTTGTETTITVNNSGTITSLPSSTTANFSTIPSAAQTALQTLAAANGVSGTITGTQSVTVYDEGNGTTIYSVTLSATDSSTSQTFNLTISVDQAGNPTVPPQNRGGGGCGGDGDGDILDHLGGRGFRHHR